MTNVVDLHPLNKRKLPIMFNRLDLRALPVDQFNARLSDYLGEETVALLRCYVYNARVTLYREDCLAMILSVLGRKVFTPEPVSMHIDKDGLLVFMPFADKPNSVGDITFVLDKEEAICSYTLSPKVVSLMCTDVETAIEFKDLNLQVPTEIIQSVVDNQPYEQ